MAGPAPVSVQITVNPRDIARISKRLSKWQGKPLEQRMDKAIRAGLSLMVRPIRAKAPQPGHERAPRDATGQLAGSVQVWKLRKRVGEVAAYAVGPRGGRSKTLKIAPHRHLVIRGHRMVTHAGAQVGFVQGNPFVDEAVGSMEPSVRAFISEQITRLA